MSELSRIFIYWECVTEVCQAERDWRGKSSKLIDQQQTNRSSGEQIPRIYLYSFWALFVLYDVQLENNYIYY